MGFWKWWIIMRLGLEIWSLRPKIEWREGRITKPWSHTDIKEPTGVKGKLAET